MRSQQPTPSITWLNRASQELVDAVNHKMRTEPTEPMFSSSDGVNHGMSFGGTSLVGEQCLSAIRKDYLAKNKRPRVADIGAGFGAMTWKLLVAGAQVDAIEKHTKGTEEIKKRSKALPLKFFDQSKLSDILKVYNDNALTLLTNQKFTALYDYVWIGNVFHFLTPNEMQAMMGIIKHILKPGGAIFAETNTIQAFKHYDNYDTLVTTYNKAKLQGNQFPGFLCINSAHLQSRQNPLLGSNGIAYVLDESDMSKHSIPTKTTSGKLGYVSDRIKERGAKELEDELKKMSLSNPDFYIKRQHVITNLLDEAVLTRLFQEGGFASIHVAQEICDNDVVQLTVSAKTKSQPVLVALMDSHPETSEKVGQQKRSSYLLAAVERNLLFAAKAPATNESFSLPATKIPIYDTNRIGLKQFRD